MPTALDDLIHDLGDKREMVSEVAKVSILPPSEVSKFFPGIEVSDSKYIAYFPFTICTSLPNINKRGRCFTPQVLERSFLSFTDQLVNFEHELAANGRSEYGDDDKIVGHIKAVRFAGKAGSFETASLDSIKNFKMPTESIPVMGLGVVYLRSKRGREIVASHMSETAKWSSSMECYHDPRKAALLYRGELIPIGDAEEGMIRCVKKGSVDRYKGHEVALALGGIDGTVDFYGAALTETPADPNAPVMCFAGGLSRELASKKVFYIPAAVSVLPTSELASKFVDNQINELASIDVLGQTDPCPADGHCHTILSNMTVMPEQGHSHYMSQFTINRGSNPTVTGVLSDHHKSVPTSDGRYSDHVHSHLIKISLKGKPKGKSDSPGVLPDDELASVLQELRDMPRSITQISNDIKAVLAKGGQSQSNDTINALNGLLNEVNEIASVESVKTAAKQLVDEMISNGQLVTKEKASEEVKAAVDTIKAEHEAEIKAVEAKAARIEEVRKLGIEPDYEIEDGLTISSLFDSIPVDEAGEKAVKIHLATFKRMKEAMQAQADAAKAAADAAAAAKPANAAAASGTVSTTEVASTKTKKPFLLAGAGSSEVASTTQTNTNTTQQTTKFGKGKSALSAL